MGRTGGLAAIVIFGLTGPAFAGADGYCDAYARDFATRKTGDSVGILAGTIGGDGSSTLPAAPPADSKWRASYDNAFKTCMDSYAPGKAEPAADSAPAKTSNKPPETEPVAEPAPDPLPAKKSEKPREAAAGAAPVKKPEKLQRGTKAWAAYCAGRYRSFDPDTGKYKSYSGTMRPCRY